MSAAIISDTISERCSLVIRCVVSWRLAKAGAIPRPYYVWPKELQRRCSAPACLSPGDGCLLSSTVRMARAAVGKASGPPPLVASKPTGLTRHAVFVQRSRIAAASLPGKRGVSVPPLEPRAPPRHSAPLAAISEDNPVGALTTSLLKRQRASIMDPAPSRVANLPASDPLLIAKARVQKQMRLELKYIGHLPGRFQIRGKKAAKSTTWVKNENLKRQRARRRLAQYRAFLRAVPGGPNVAPGASLGLGHR